MDHGIPAVFGASYAVALAVRPEIKRHRRTAARIMKWVRALRGELDFIHDRR